MRRLDRPVVLTILFAVLVTAIAGALHHLTTTRECIDLVVASSQEKTTLMQAAAKDFNASRPVVGVRCVSVSVELVKSGAAEQALVADWKGQTAAKPDVWSPAATTWLVLLAQHRKGRNLAPLFGPVDPPSLMQSPLVIAMPEDMATALGHPTRPLGWKSIFDLAHNPRGWAAYDHQEWGALRLGKTNPNLSTSGLNALISTYFAASDKASDLTLGDLKSATVIDFVQRVESSVVHYGDTATTFLKNLRAEGQRNSTPYVHAVAVEEKEVWNYNVGNVSGDPSLAQAAVLPKPLLTAIYPEDGTIKADHPYAILKWATPDKKAAADMFLVYLLAEKSQQLFRDSGFRDHEGDSGPQISSTNRLNPAQPNYKTLPTGDVIAAIQDSWSDLRKPARVLIVVDVSASAGADRLAAIKSPLAAALGKLGPRDQAGLWQAPGANQSVDELVRAELLTATQIEQIRSGIKGLVAKGQANLVDVVQESLDFIHSSYDTNRIDAIVLLSPGHGATPEFQRLLQTLRNQPTDQPIHVFTVAYGDHPDVTRLSQIALNSDAGFYTPSPGSSLDDLMIQVLSNF